MSRIHEVIHRYATARAVAEHGVSIFAVGDPSGAQLNAAIRRTLFTLGDERSDVWTDLLQAANALRWRRMTQPQPNSYQPAQVEIVEAVLRHTKRLRHFVGDESLLDQLAASATAVSETDSPLGPLLLDSIREVGESACIVVATKGSARAGLQVWLDQAGVPVLVPGELGHLSAGTEQSYVIAPPAFVPSSLMTAPATSEVTFVIPAWFGNRAAPCSSLGPHAEGRIEVKAAVYEIGDTTEPPETLPNDTEVMDTYFPQPVWDSRLSADREPASDEVMAWKVLLGGGLALWLDDGDRIRSLDPRQPEGDRVGYTSVSDVTQGTYLVLREGETERGVMYDQAMRALGPRAEGILATQERWKRALQQRLDQRGVRRAADELFALGVRSAGQVRAWTEARLICPQRDTDFALLLEWLAMTSQPTYDNAITLRRAVHKASAGLRKELELAVSQANFRTLERDGILHLDVSHEGFRGMIVTRVLARSPFTEIVTRSQVRLPFSDVSAQWLD
ncbi:hypothetical protein [Ornithinimicrobium cavernae]|uniref:hypothetical protein n=1 Tax=Ornithinimicrobium cavernae TaxID=2666047 RepID=UPI000D69FF26|nr:hypothetical protein [Ornithinimicrobium cavernae]